MPPILKRALSRALVSAPSCMLINHLVGVVRSLIVGDGRFSPVTPAFAARFPSESAAVAVQMLLVGLVGAAFAGCSVVFDIERWSFLRQGLVHLAATSAVAVPVCLYCGMPETPGGALALVGSGVFCYAATWLSKYLLNRRRVRELDARIKAINGDK